MTLSVLAFLVLVAAFAIGSLTSISAGLLALVAAFGVGSLAAGLPLSDVIGEFPAGLFLILVGATLLFGIVRETGTIDLMAYWAERLAGGRRLLVPVLMFALAALLAAAGAFTPAAIAIVAPVALALGSRFGISSLAMGLVVIQGANAGAFSPVNPFGVIANDMLDQAGGDATLRLFLSVFAFNAVLAVVAYAVVQSAVGWLDRRSSAATPAGDTDGPTAGREPGPGGGAATAVAERTAVSGITRVRATPMRILTLVGMGSLLVLTTVLGIDVGVATLVIALVLIIVRPSVQKPVIDAMPWSAILLVTGIVTYVGMLETIGALDDLQEGIAGLGNASLAALAVSYVVGLASAFASTTGTLTVIGPVVAPIAADPTLSVVGVVTAVGISSSVVDTSPMSTSGALLMASAPPRLERMFFRALLLWAIAMIAIVPVVAWLLFVQLGSG
ncbi:SLC13 family permease [Pseudonocardia sp. ICBG1293]|uniref:SLC13 family permease n=1 Tax=Pseudonocardia sp. ICBG1293 TaxID=2844382 RepID=UPI001CCB1A77|nr:SLC13 family permease [Pseudonocardia sp. ICBG1293]